MPQTVRCGAKVTVPCSSASRLISSCSRCSWRPSGQSQIDAIFSSPPCLAKRGGQIHKAATSIDQGRRVGRVLLRLDNKPAAVIRCLERGEHCGEINRAVARHRKNPLEHGGEKAL